MSLQERLEIIRSAPAPQNEESAKFQILAPILQSLGWDPSEMLPEHQVGEMSRRGRVDIVLKTKGRILGLIEAKAPGTRLDNHVDQVLGYAFYESVEICALTTGLEWWLYLPGARVPVPKRRFAVLRVMEDPIERLSDDFTSFLGKDSLVNGQAEEQAKRRLEHVRLNSEVPSIWNQMLQEPDEELVGLVRRRVDERAHLKLTSEQVAATLQGSPIPSADVPAELSVPTSSAPQSAQTAKGQKPQQSAKPIAMELWGERHEVESHADAFRKVLDALYEKHGDEFDRVLELRGHKYPYAARDPEMFKPEGKKYNYEQQSSGYFFDLWCSARGFKRRARQFLEHFGHDPSEFKVLYD